MYLCSWKVWLKHCFIFGVKHEWEKAIGSFLHSKAESRQLLWTCILHKSESTTWENTHTYKHKRNWLRIKDNRQGKALISYLFDPSLTLEMLKESRDFFLWQVEKLLEFGTHIDHSGRRMKMPTTEAKLNTLILPNNNKRVQSFITSFIPKRKSWSKLKKNQMNHLKTKTRVRTKASKPRLERISSLVGSKALLTQPAVGKSLSRLNTFDCWDLPSWISRGP